MNQQCVCISTQNNDKVKDIIAKSRGHPRRRLQYIYDLAKVKSVCEGGDSMDTKFDATSEIGELKAVSYSIYMLIF